MLMRPCAGCKQDEGRVEGGGRGRWGGSLLVGLPTAVPILRDVDLEDDLIGNAVARRLLRGVGGVMSQVAHTQDAALAEGPPRELCQELLVPRLGMTAPQSFDDRQTQEVIWVALVSAASGRETRTPFHPR